ncbi:MAG: complex I NDUFA9 subunit family protein [Alphaproteobacteria bacterium]
MAETRVTVFGGSGFIGRHLVRRLATHGAIVRVAVRDPERAQFLKPLGDVGQIVPRAADITNAASVARAIDGADWVVNLVGILYERGARTFESIHVDAVRALAKAVKEAGVRRMVHVSALGARETSESRYARSKAMGERVLRDVLPESIIVRPSVVFGPEDDFFNRFAALARYSPVLPVLTNDLLGGQGVRLQPVYVGDVADAIMKTLTGDGVTGKTFELGGPRVYTLREIMDLVVRMVDRRRLVLPMPYWLASLEASVLQYLPKPPLTPDQVTLLKADNVVGGGLPGFAELGLVPTSAEPILPTYLDRFRSLHRHTVLRSL